MADLSDIIKVNITRSTASVSTTSFNIPLFLASFTNFKERAQTYTSLSAVADIFDTSSNVYIAAQKFLYDGSVTSFVIGRRQIPSVSVAVSTVTEGATYTITISDVDYTYTAVTDDTAAIICAGLATAYASADLDNITFTDNEDGTFEVASTVDWSFSADSKFTVTNATPTETWVEALNAVVDENDSWYIVTCESHTDSDIELLAADVEARSKLYVASTASSAVITSATTDIASSLQDSTYYRTALVYDPNADTTFPECAWVGVHIAEQPGSSSWAENIVSGMTAVALSATANTYLTAKNVSSCQTVGGVNVVLGGKTSGGEWVDVMVFVDWLEAKISENLWYLIVNSKKVPYTQAGIAKVAAVVTAQLKEGVRVGGLTDNPAFVVTIPDISSISSSTKSTRVLDTVSFEAYLAGAIHFVTISGNVSY